MFNEKLNKRENEVMGAVYALSGGKERFLAAPYDLLALLPPKADYDEEKLERVLHSLELDGYFDLIASDRKGEKTYVVHMREAGLGFSRSNTQRKRGLYFKLGVAALTGALSFLIGMILRAIFS